MLIQAWLKLHNKIRQILRNCDRGPLAHQPPLKAQRPHPPSLFISINSHMCLQVLAFLYDLNPSHLSPPSLYVFIYVEEYRPPPSTKTDFFEKSSKVIASQNDPSVPLRM